MGKKRRLSAPGPATTAILSAAGVFLVASADFFTPPDMTFSLLYLAPIVVGTWFGGRWTGVATAVLAAASWSLVEATQVAYVVPWVPYWNGSIRLGVFMIVSLLLDAVHGMRSRLQFALRERTNDLEREIDEHRRTERALADVEEKFREARKLEAIGRLAGGVAHDFRNDLTLIQGYCDLALADAGANEVLAATLQEIHRACRRASSLTGQLLAFGRREVLRPRVVSVNRVLRRMESAFAQVSGAGVRLTLSLQEDAGNAFLDVDRFETAVMNLVVNARDAMPAGGRLRIETDRARVDRSEAERSPGAAPGQYVRVSVTDSGFGMSEEVKRRLFEPYFTTKGEAGGAGLGLAMVHGFASQSGGFLDVQSESGRGSTFRLCFPSIAARETGEGDEAPAAPVPGGTETVMVVEDNVSLRDLTATLLTRRGYRTIAATDCRHAESIVDDGTEFDLLLTDVLMPDITGTELARRIRSKRPGVRVLFMSAVAPTGLDPRDPLIAKPFLSDDLARAVRSALDAPRG
jgi:signal transduction histidine kinase/CheY-like chemotaxis protein